MTSAAVKGRKTAALVSSLCYVISALSLFTLNILMAAIGFAAAYHIKRGSLTARNVGIILRIADLPVLAVIAFVFRKYGALMPIPYIGVFSVIAVIALLDVTALFTLIFSKSANAYFHEVSDSVEALADGMTSAEQ
ncbi:MAG: hypothetical protein K2K44_10825 [Oscillospiraceae bacterium]|nr:hypothetical protein [Oscillospiraceae bacterium]